MIEHVAIIGAGFSGTLQAINLLRYDGPRATLIERAGQAGEGLAFGAAHPSHLLNVRAANMSAFPDEPEHFARWLAGRGIANAASAFVPRLLYGIYLRELLDGAMARAQGRLQVIRAEVTDLERAEAVRLIFADGRSLQADAAVLAVGNLPPHDPPGLAASALSPDRYQPDPWHPRVSDGLGADDTVLILGTGLTMIDVALLLEAKDFPGRIVALSRRGLLPRSHTLSEGKATRLVERPGTTASELVRCVRARGREIGWRHAVDELRPHTQTMWASASDAERARFLRHLRPWWDVHRHRLAPGVADRIAAMRERGQLRVVAGKTLAFRERTKGVEVQWRPRGVERAERLVVTRVVNCTGPLGDLQRSDEPLLRNLAARGTIRPDAAHLGIEVNGSAETIGATGASNEWLFALGPMTRGAFWEIVAVPDIRWQTWNLARRLSHAHWVGGEGL